ncbi:Fur-regulated basic protein FbpA [Bacillus sp. C1]
MSSQLRFAVENRKRRLIDQLIKVGVFKVLDRQLYELSLEELEKEYKDITKYAGVRA